MLLGSKVINAFDIKVVDGLVEGSGTATEAVGGVFRKLQTGIVNNYALVLSFGAVALLAYMMLG
jgi:NADH-quinone oxidoreductase subunit L